MIKAIADYICQNYVTIIYDLIMILVGTVIGLLVTGKEKKPEFNNSKSMKQITLILQEKIIIKQESLTERKTVKKSKNNEDDNSLVLLLFIVCTAIYIKYRIEIIQIFTGVTLLIIASTVTIAIKLHKNDNLDELNKWWICLSLIIAFCNISAIYFMNKQEIFVGGNFDDLMRYSYYAIGVFYLILPNLFSIMLNIHLYALNSYMRKSGSVSLWFLIRTKRFIKSPKIISTIAVVMCILALLFTSGKGLELLKSLLKWQSDQLTNIINLYMLEKC